MEPPKMDQTAPPAARPTWAESLQLATTLLTPAKEVLIVIRPSPSFDLVCASIALSAAFKKIGRRSNIVCPTKIPPETITTPLPLDGNQILDFMPKKQLTVTVDYQEGSFSQGKIQQGAEGVVLTLMPKAGEQALVPKKMESVIYESQPDVAVMLEVENLAHLTDIYLNNKDFFTKIPIINIDYHATNTVGGKVNFIDTKATSMSEVTTLFLYDLRFILDKDIAETLYKGIKSKTENFTEGRFTANMLEATSICLRYMNLPAPKPL
jgi:nanoRNase/pAp phosphatase (c-di-AMP/oligoRNAs hydrolase)